MIIAFSGCSGSGKTTQLKKLKGWDYFKGKRVVVKDEDSFVLVRLAKIFFGEKRFTEYKDNKMSIDEDSSGTSLFTSFTNFFYPVAVYLEYLIDYIIYEVLFKKKILLKDRYIYDYLVTFEHNLKLKRPLIRFLYLNFPLPYLLFYLDVDLKTILERNKNNVKGKITSDENFHREVIAAYREIGTKKNLLVIKNNVKGSAEEIKFHIKNKDKFTKVKRIVVTGLDGAGKTTLATNFTNYLSKLGISWKVAHFYHDNMLHKLLKKVGYYNKNETKEVIYERSRAHNIKVKAEGKPFVWGLLHYIDSYVQLIFFNIMYFNKFIIYDRYFYDFLVSFEFLRVPYREFFARLIIPVKNKFLLMCSPEVMFKRKPETTLEFATEHFDIYIKLVEKYGLTIIDSEKNRPKEVLAKLINEISI